MAYLVRRAKIRPKLDDEWPDADVERIAHFHVASSDHRPVTTFRMLYDDDGIYIAFHVRDRYVLCRRNEHQSMVCKDSCVEAFLQPRPDHGYFNFELNCGGAMLLYYVRDPQRLPTGGMKEWERVPAEL
ncbi:MAG: hypothetical protein QOE14_1163, partial [Humisphaera sp.]|nr:hypothetical protein [Humisphaera sp.]